MKSQVLHHLGAKKPLLFYKNQRLYDDQFSMKCQNGKIEQQAAELPENKLLSSVITLTD